MRAVAEHRWNQVWALLPYGLLVTAYGISLFSGAPAGYHLVTLALTAGFATWGWSRPTCPG
ncbi:hypothetical protein [Paractinoplanes lichenicola]|uniref:Uncharacterized protein n=1 Tax=Paractinoplanes lichenicola TaxID=2802976 RepID=A0ABS1VHP4_9ACTN|nr:hypothetical protein [Actinoplanes lichenicola]MBL7254231.1 hypothetical protein [Actinoplanes lichenicola]